MSTNTGRIYIPVKNVKLKKNFLIKNFLAMLKILKELGKQLKKLLLMVLKQIRKK